MINLTAHQINILKRIEKQVPGVGNSYKDSMAMHGMSGLYESTQPGYHRYFKLTDKGRKALDAVS